MGAKFYFFTDPALLQAQPDLPASGQLSYGPAVPLGGKDQFRITDRHNFASSGAPAVATCDGVLCAQEDDQGGLTLILKPSQAPPFESPVVSYFIYKGIDKGSLLNSSGDQILDEVAATATEFTKKIAKEWKKQNPDLVGSRAALGLDRDAAFQHDDGTKIFTGNDPIDRLFSYPHKTVQLSTVAAGDVIGSFKTDAGFEIVLQRLGYAPKLAFARLFENYISVPSLSADNGGTPWLADDSAYFEHWHSKEQVLAYMDPCAFFGGFVQAALYKKSAGNESKIDGGDVYPEILKKFANRNIAWLDIRNNYSTSYNLFGLYDDTLRFVSHSDASVTNDKNFRAGSWPILQLRIADVPGSRRGSLHRTRLRLPVGKSSAPAVLVSKGFVTTLGPERPKYKAPPIAADSADPAFYLPIRLAFPVTSDGGPVFSCSYTRVNIYEKPHAGQPAAPLSIAGKEYLDGVFRLRDLQLDTDYAGNNLRFRIYPEDVLVDLEARYGPTYSAAVGIAQDASTITLFAFPSYFLPNTFGPKDRQPLPSWADVSSGDTQDFLTRLARTFDYTDITKKTITPGGAQNDVDTLIVRHEPSINHNPATDKNSLEHYCLLVLPKLDHQALLAELAADTGADANLPAFLAVSASTAKHDAAHDVDYVEIALQSTGFATSGSKAARHDTPLTKKVYVYADA